MNLNRRNSCSILGAGSRIEQGAQLVNPVRLYGSVSVDRKSSIGKYTYVGTGCYVVNSSIGNYCSIARNVEIGAREHPLTMLSSHPFQYNRNHFTNQPGYGIGRVKSLAKQDSHVVIGSDVWIGTKAVIHGGVTIGHGSVIGSGAIVTKDVAPYSIVAGVPAKLIRYRFDSDVISSLLASEWWKLDPADLDGIDFQNALSASVEARRRLDYFKRQIRQRLLEEQENILPSKKGIIWFDIEKSYTYPDSLINFTKAKISLKNARVTEHRIEKSWFSHKECMYAIRLESFEKQLEIGECRFMLS